MLKSFFLDFQFGYLAWRVERREFSLTSPCCRQLRFSQLRLASSDSFINPAVVEVIRELPRCIVNSSNVQDIFRVLVYSASVNFWMYIWLWDICWIVNRNRIWCITFLKVKLVGSMLSPFFYFQVENNSVQLGRLWSWIKVILGGWDQKGKLIIPRANESQIMCEVWKTNWK